MLVTPGNGAVGRKSWIVNRNRRGVSMEDEPPVMQVTSGRVVMYVWYATLKCRCVDVMKRSGWGPEQSGNSSKPLVTLAGSCASWYKPERKYCLKGPSAASCGGGQYVEAKRERGTRRSKTGRGSGSQGLIGRGDGGDWGLGKRGELAAAAAAGGRTISERVWARRSGLGSEKVTFVPFFRDG
jgi:hypothetical protein